MFTGERIARLAQQCVERQLSPEDIRRIADMLPLVVFSVFILELELRHGITLPVAQKHHFN